MADAAHPPIPLTRPVATTMRLVWLRIRRNWLSSIALAIIVAMIVAALGADWIAPFEPDATDAEAALQAPAPTSTGATCSRASSMPVGSISR